jgi:hypothetical protein
VQNVLRTYAIYAFMATEGLKLQVFTQIDRLVVHNFNVETLCRQKNVTIFSVAKFREPSETI